MHHVHASFRNLINMFNISLGKVAFLAILSSRFLSRFGKDHTMKCLNDIDIRRQHHLYSSQTPDNHLPYFRCVFNLTINFCNATPANVSRRADMAHNQR